MIRQSFDAELSWSPPCPPRTNIQTRTITDVRVGFLEDKRHRQNADCHFHRWNKGRFHTILWAISIRGHGSFPASACPTIEHKTKVPDPTWARLKAGPNQRWLSDSPFGFPRAPKRGYHGDSLARRFESGPSPHKKRPEGEGDLANLVYFQSRTNRPQSKATTRQWNTEQKVDHMIVGFMGNGVSRRSKEPLK